MNVVDVLITLLVLVHAAPIGFAAARKYRRGGSVPPGSRQSRRATASSADTVIPRP
jgi:hypothetical protein